MCNYCIFILAHFVELFAHGRGSACCLETGMLDLILLMGERRLEGRWVINVWVHLQHNPHARLITFCLKSKCIPVHVIW